MFSFSGTLIPGQAIFELKDHLDQVIISLNDEQLDSLIVSLDVQEGGIQTIVLDLSQISDPRLANVRFVNLVLNPQITGPNADFFVHQIVFRQFPSQIPPVLAVVNLPTVPDFEQILNFRVLQLQQQGNLAFGTIEFSPYQDFSIERAVFGFRSNKGISRLFVELEDEEGNKFGGYVTGIGTEASYYEFLKKYVPTEVDLSKIKKINIVIDGTALEGGATLDDLTLEMGLA